MKYQRVHTKIWNDDKFLTLSVRGQRFFLYLLTSPHSNLLGMYTLKPGYVCDDLKSLPKDFRKDLAEVLGKDLIKYDSINQVVLLPKYLLYNPLANPNQAKAAISIIRDFPQTPLLQDLKVLIEGLTEGLTKGLLKVLNEVLTEGVTKPLRNPSETLPKPLPNTDTDTDTDTNNPPTPLAKGEVVDNKTGKIEPHSEGFLAFWNCYPRKIGKRAAQKVWQATAKERPPNQELLASLETQKQSWDWRKDGGKFIPHPATWLNQGRWADEVGIKKAEVPKLPPPEVKPVPPLSAEELDKAKQWEEGHKKRQATRTKFLAKVKELARKMKV